MFTTDPYVERRESEATRILSILKNEEPLTTAINDDAKQIDGEIVRVSVEALNVKIGNNSFASAKVEIEKVSIGRKIYLEMLKILNKADYKEVPFRQTVCGLIVIITFKVIVLR